ncbi:BadF/BadG/BcrA/BcrD ATPase family protein [Cryobacterium sp. PH31-L1]|uniref:N-acetylglucosamine kinase n=1 Tax=Cryobacterium sp. PH31-L1 TaxID=3046199 RepID=UPI0024BA83CF|nr:BadF/BadG/BcrA/BcrD ATPase family protein [Cryobacterium sp. PH31-L1]MDJ0376999.1 BadF/BadG/BcrA/BcrD ATPase family protein [Cryobacterium sp. PH31-L1]
MVNAAVDAPVPDKRMPPRATVFDPSPYVAIDIGGSGSRVYVGSAHAPSAAGDLPLASATGPSVMVGPSGIDVEALIGTLVGLGDQLRRAQGLGSPLAVVVGMSGLMELVDRPTRVTDAIAALWPRARTVVASDSVTALVGALGIGGGAVVAAGTGVVGLGSDLDTVWNRVDGWGHLLGDAGGGAWIGMQGLRAAVRAYDGRAGGSALLLKLATRDLGEVHDLPRMLYTRDDRAGVMATFVPAMVEAAHAGDAVAAAVWQRAGQALAETAQAALTPQLPQRVALVGGLLAAGRLLTDPFNAAAERLLPGVHVHLGGGGSLQGAAVLARHLVLDPAMVPHHPPFITRVLPAVE